MPPFLIAARSVSLSLSNAPISQTLPMASGIVDSVNVEGEKWAVSQRGGQG